MFSHHTLHLLALLLLLHHLLPRSHAGIVAAASSSGSNLGINCRGSSQCSFTTVNSPNILREFNISAHGVPPSSPSPPPTNFLPGLPLLARELYFRDERIICAQNALLGSICLFLQGGAVPAAGVPGFVVKARLRDLLRHGCLFCGSVPVSGDNRPGAAGVLTSNYVLEKGCQGVCDLRRKRVFWEGRGSWAFIDQERSEVGKVRMPPDEVGGNVEGGGGQQAEGGPYHFP